MALAKRIESLHKRHADIDDEILAIQARPSPDDAMIQQLKREKLLIKDEVSKLEDELRQEQAA